MSQPLHAPVERADRVRKSEQTPPARRWLADRPGEALAAGRPPTGPRFGAPGTDQGYGLKLARRFEDRLRIGAGESADDAVAGCLAVGLKRASLFHRAPVVFDFELAYLLWGFLGDAPDDLAAFRKKLFAHAAHDYDAQRAVADRVPEATLRLTPAEVAARIADWRALLTT